MSTQSAPAKTPNRMTLDKIHRGKRVAPDRILLVGVEGIGKSTFGASAPSPIFIAAEDGVRHLDVASFPEPKSYRDVLDALTTLGTTDHEFKTLVVDTLDWLEPLIGDEVCKRNGWADLETPGYGKGHVAAAAEWRKFLQTLDRLRAAKGMEIILLAHSTMRSVPNPTGPDYSRYEGKLNKNAMALVKEWTDVNLFAIHEEFVQKGKGDLRAKVTASGRRIIHTERSAGFDAKNRYGLPPVLPLDYAAFAEARAAGVPASAETLEAEARALLTEIPEAQREKIGKRLDAAKGNAELLAKAVTFLKSTIEQKESA